MALILTIHWHEGRIDLPLGVGRSGVAEWADLADELPLSVVAQLGTDGLPPFGPSTLEQLIGEFESLRVRVAERYPQPAAPGTVHPTEPIDHILAQLDRLRGLRDWRGDFAWGP